MDRKAIRIMIVGDRIELRNIIRSCLKAEGFEKLVVSESGPAALRKAREEPPHLIVVDGELAGSSGLDFLRAVRQDRDLADTPFILISSDPQRMNVARAAEHRVSAYIIKPFSHQTLADKVNHLLERVLYPSTSHVEYLEANRLAETGDLEGALEKYGQALAGARRSMAAIHYRVGRVHEKMDKRPEAEDDYQEATAMSDLYAEAWDALGRMELETGRFGQAAGHLGKSIGISPLNAGRQLRYGESLLAMGEAEKAEKAFRASLEIDPDQSHAFNRLGISLRRQGKNEEAERWLLRAAEAADEDENLHYNLARVYLDRRDRERALTHLDHALRINPDFDEAKKLKEELDSAGEP